MGRPTPPDSASATIAFYAIGKWDAEDLQRFVTALSAMYGLLLVCTGEVGESGEIPALFRRGVTLLDEELQVLPLSVMDLLRPAESRDVFLRQLELEYQNEPGHRLYVQSIQIAEPGTAVFEGVGPVIGQLREFIGNLWSRTRAERERQEADQLRNFTTSWEAQMALRVQQVSYATEYLRGQGRYRELAGQSDERFLSQAGAIFAHSVEDLDDLVTSGRILEAPEHLADAE